MVTKKQVQYSYPNMLCICKICPKSAQTVSKCLDNKSKMSRIANLPKTENDLG